MKGVGLTLYPLFPVSAYFYNLVTTVLFLIPLTKPSSHRTNHSVNYPLTIDCTLQDSKQVEI